MRPSVAALLAVGLLLPARAQDSAPAIPPGFTAYIVSGPGINAPPLPFRIEGDHLVMPEDADAIVSLIDSRLEGDRLTMSLETPSGPARFLAVRDGDGFVGYVFLEDDRVALPITMVPAGTATSIEPSAELLATAPGISRIEVVPGGLTLASAERQRFVARVYDEDGREIADPDVVWYSKGGTISAEGEFYGLNAGPREIVALADGAVRVYGALNDRFGVGWMFQTDEKA